MGELLGRRDECDALDRLVADVLAGASRVLVLSGDAGVGKSALLAYLSARMAGWRVVSAVGVESEMELAYSAYLGHGQLAHSTPGVLPATRAGRRAYLDDAIRALTTR